ncbi:MAG TPA: hypothetical protein VFF52_31350 [Isosphaeraceae bacterium]|nr:hypothetical protein [Isosphaeraceae bacterium]
MRHIVNRRRFPKITVGRAARLHRLVRLLVEQPRRREAILQGIGIGLRTFYRELKLLKRCGITVQRKGRMYTLRTTAEPVEGRLPFPDPQLNFAEMSELARCPGPAAQRLAEILARVIDYQPMTAPRVPHRSRKRASPPRPNA